MDLIPKMFRSSGLGFWNAHPSIAKLNAHFLKADIAGRNGIVLELRNRLVVKDKLPAMLADLEKCDRGMVASVFSENKYSDHNAKVFLRRFMDRIDISELSTKPEYRTMLMNVASFEMDRDFDKDSLPAFAFYRLIGHKSLPEDLDTAVKASKLSQKDLKELLLHEPSEPIFKLIEPLMRPLDKGFEDPKAIALYIAMSLGKKRKDFNEQDLAWANNILHDLSGRRYEQYSMRDAVLNQLLEINYDLAAEVGELDMPGPKSV
jgi:hypothetical protein